MEKYVVKRGDTLSRIARINNTTISALVALNNIKDPNKIYVGQVLNLPTVNTTPEPEADSKDYKAIGKTVENLVEKVEKLPEFDTLMKLLG